MTQKAKSPLTKEQQQQIEAGLRALHDAIPTIQLLESCGEDCAHYRALFDDYQRQLETLRKGVQ